MKTISLLFCLISLLFKVTSGAYSTVPSRTDPSHSLRWKRLEDGQICNGGRESYVGWVDVADKHLFYWYHPAQSHADATPVMVWLQGGPGGSSLAGMFTENGPCLVKHDRNETVVNEYSWTSAYHMIYLDQPVGVGLSYLTNNSHQASYPSRAEDSAIDFVHALRMLLEAFPDLKERPIYLGGESYAGRYVPVYADTILTYNQFADQGSRIPLASIAVGNPLTSAFEQVPSIYDISCHKHHNIEPVLNRTSCDQLAKFVDSCEVRALQCQETKDSSVCYEASQYCAANFWTALDGTGVNKYNRVQRCGGDCYPDMDWIDQWMNFEEQRSTLELDKQTVGSVTPVRYTSLNWDVFTRFNMSGDLGMSSAPNLVRVLEAEVQVLYYGGVNDWICNVVGLKRFLENLRWTRHAEFRALPMEPLPWLNSEGQVAGYTKAVEGLHWVELTGGGHMIPHDQPQSSLRMISTWRRRVEAASSITTKGQTKKYGQLVLGM